MDCGSRVTGDESWAVASRSEGCHIQAKAFTCSGFTSPSLSPKASTKGVQRVVGSERFCQPGEHMLEKNPWGCV